MNEYVDYFKSSDLNKDGKLDREEVIHHYAKNFLPGYKILDEKLAGYWRLTERKFDGELSFENLLES